MIRDRSSKLLLTGLVLLASGMFSPLLNAADAKRPPPDVDIPEIRPPGEDFVDEMLRAFHRQ